MIKKYLYKNGWYKDIFGVWGNEYYRIMCFDQHSAIRVQLILDRQKINSNICYKILKLFKKKKYFPYEGYYE